MTQNATWILDEGSLSAQAAKLKEKFPERLGTLDLDKVMFARVIGAKLIWAGKCYCVRPPWNLLTQALNLFGGHVEEPIDIRYIIVINDDLVRGIFIAPEKEAMIVLHELQHIRDDMEGTVPHDVEDFSWMLREFGVDWVGDSDPEILNQFSDVIEDPPEGSS